MHFKKLRNTLISFGEFLKNFNEGNHIPVGNLDKQDYQDMDSAINKGSIANQWFILPNIEYALKSWSSALIAQNIDTWLKPYESLIKNEREVNTIAVIMAGNLPIVGLHDLLCVIISGHKFLGKMSSDDKHLMPYIANLLIKINPDLKDVIKITDLQLKEFDAVIATGSNNTSRYFEYYFGKYPNIIRKNRNGIAVLSGEESDVELNMLADDVLLYFGLGCRSVSKIYIPQNFEIPKLLDAFGENEIISQNHKYLNNYDFNKSIYLVNKVKHFDNGYLLLKEDEKLSSPVSVLYYEYYENIHDLEKKILSLKNQIQCIISKDTALSESIAIGKSQQPELWDYADGIDTMKFLLKI